MTRMSVVLLLVISLLFPLSLTAAHAQSVSGDEAFNAIQVLLGLTKESNRPSCARLNSKTLRFCPLIAKCPTDKPFCVSVPLVTNNSRSTRFNCECSKTLIPVPKEGESGIKGIMSYGPLCPVVPVDGSCLDTFYSGKFVVLNASQIIVFQGETDKNGKFSLKLEPGSYVLRVTQTAKFGAVEGRTITQNFEVAVKKGSYTDLQTLHIDFPGPRPL